MPKTTTSKKVKKEDHVDIVDVEPEPEEVEQEPVQKKTSRQSKKVTATPTPAPTPAPEPVAVVTKGKKAEPIVSDWNEMGDDISVEDVGQGDVSNEDEPDDDEQRRPRNTFKSGGNRVQGTQGSKSSRFANSVTNFSYQTYADLETPVNELSNKDLVKILIVRSYGENQHDFCKTMKTVLRAMNLECPMPGTRPVAEGQTQQYPQHTQQYNQSTTRPPRNAQSSGKPYQGQQSMFGQRNQPRRSNDPHDF